MARSVCRRDEQIDDVLAAPVHHAAKMETMQGFNVWRWSDRGLNYWAVSDLGADELAEFGEKLEAASRSSHEG